MKTRRADAPFDPFAVLGIARSIDVSAVELERRYLTLSREHHPDFHTTSDPAAQARSLQASAQINDAYRALKNPWSRAEHLVEVEAPGAMQRHKTLPQSFLVDAMELAEEVEAAATADETTKEDLRHRLRHPIDEYLQRIHMALRSADFDRAAVLLHEARYYRKALRDIDDPR